MPTNPFLPGPAGNLKPNLPTAKRDILRFIQSMVSRSIYRGIEFILSPCCNISIVSAVVTPLSGSVHSVTLTLSSPISFLGKAEATLFLTSGSTTTAIGPVGVPDGATVVFPTVGLAAGTYSLSLQAVMPATNSGASEPFVGFTTPAISVTL